MSTACAEPILVMSATSTTTGDMCVYGGGGPASDRNAPASTRSARVTVSMFEVPDRTENLPSGSRVAVIVRLSAEPRLSSSICPRISWRSTDVSAQSLGRKLCRAPATTSGEKSFFMYQHEPLVRQIMLSVLHQEFKAWLLFL